MSTDTLLYGVRWENGDVEMAYTRPLAVCLGGLWPDETSVKTDWGQVTLMASADGGQTWTEVSK